MRPTRNCPCCHGPLVDNQVEEFQVRLCTGCRGILLPHADVVKILEQSWKAVKEVDAEKMEFRPPAAAYKPRHLKCPDCQQLMEEYGYMGLAAILIDRCDHCSLLWLDTDELQNMVLALAKTYYRAEKARLREWRSAVDDPVAKGAATSVMVPHTSWLFRKFPDTETVVAETLLDLFLPKDD